MQSGSELYILDWSDTDIGALVIAVTAGGEVAKAFIRERLTGTPHVGATTR